MEQGGRLIISLFSSLSLSHLFRDSSSSLLFLTTSLLFVFSAMVFPFAFVSSISQHGFRGKAQEQNPDRPGSNRTTPRHSFSLEDNAATKELMTSLRQMVETAVSRANLGQAAELKRAATEGLTEDLKEDLKKEIVNDLDLEANRNSSDGKEGSGSSVFALADPRSAQRGPDSEFDEEEVVDFPNPIAKYRYKLREGLAEMLGCFILMASVKRGNERILSEEKRRFETDLNSFLAQFSNIEFYLIFILESFHFPGLWKWNQQPSQCFGEFSRWWESLCSLARFADLLSSPPQVFVSSLYDPANPKGSYLSVSFGWGLGES